MSIRSDSIRRVFALSVLLIVALLAGTSFAQEGKASKFLGKAQDQYHEGRWYEAREAYKKAYEAAPEETAVRVESALGRSTLLWEQGNYGSASKYIGEALELAKKLELHGAVGRLLLTLGHTQASQGRLGKAEQTLKHCVQLAAEQKDPVFGPLCHLNHRLVRKLQGKNVGSDADYRKALKKLESVDSPLTVGLSLAKTAELYAQGGQRGRAFQLLSQADKQYDKAGSVPAKARNRMLKARFLQETGKWPEARKHLEGLLGQFQSMGSKPALVDVLGLLGNDAQYRNSWGEAKKRYQRALKLANATGSPQLVAKVQVALCEVGAASGDSSAAAHCEDAINTFTKLGMPQMSAQAHASSARLAQQTANLEKARDEFLTALKISEEKVHPKIRKPGLQKNVLANLCQIEMRMQLDGAYYRCRKALKGMDEESTGEAMLAATNYAMWNSAANEGHAQEATEHLEKAVKMYAGMKPRD